MKYNIYIVIGQGMGFDGYESWNVKAFFSRFRAEQYKDLCVDADKKYRFKKERLRKYYGYVCHGAKYGWEKTEHDTIVNEIDSKYDGCIGDIEYYVEPIELF